MPLVNANTNLTLLPQEKTTLRKGKGMNQDTVYFLQIELSLYKSLMKLQMI